MHILPKLGRSLVISGLALTGGALLVTKMPTKIQAAEVEVKKVASKISRKKIEVPKRYIRFATPTSFFSSVDQIHILTRLYEITAKFSIFTGRRWCDILVFAFRYESKREIFAKMG